MKKIHEIWANENEFLKIEKNGKPHIKALSFVMINNQVKFTKVFEVPKSKLDVFLSKSRYKPINKVLTLEVL